MHLLILPTTYVNSHNKTSSLFVKNQAEALQKKGLKIGIVCSLPISLKKIQFKNVLNFFYDVKIVNCIKTILFTFPSVPKIRIINNFIRFIIGKILIKKYIKENGIPDIIHVHNILLKFSHLDEKNTLFLLLLLNIQCFLYKWSKFKTT